jgi:hypothetical protein
MKKLVYLSAVALMMAATTNAIAISNPVSTTENVVHGTAQFKLYNDTEAEVTLFFVGPHGGESTQTIAVGETAGITLQFDTKAYDGNDSTGTLIFTVAHEMHGNSFTVKQFIK